MPVDLDKLQSVFLHAAAITDVAARLAWLDQACEGNPELRQRVEALLAADRSPHPLLHSPAPLADDDATPLISEEAPGILIAGRYKLLEPIGEGGMGLVWMAEQRTPVRRLVAVKLIKAGMDSRSVLTRFEAERQALAMMDHPSIARVFDGGVTDRGQPWFAMELVRGLAVTEYCDQRRMPVVERLMLYMQICSAVQHAHQKGIIHRDLKPSNVLVTEVDGLPLPKIIDFGLAKALGGAATLTERTLYTSFGAVVGTPVYMAPEQVAISAIDVDTRADVYALGVLLYELLTGTTPLECLRLKEAAWEEVCRVIREEEPPRPSLKISTSDTLPSLAASRHVEPAKLSGLVRGDLDWIVLKALEKDRNRRYESAAGLAADIQRHVADEPVLAAPPSMGYRIRKFLHKHRGPAIAASGVAAALILGIIGTSVMTLRYRAASAREAARADSESKARETAELESYIANISAAQAALSNDGYVEARERLDACPQSRRGWEWQFLRRQAESVVGTIPAGYRFDDFTPDGTRMVVVATDGTVQWWDLMGHPVGERITAGMEGMGFRTSKTYTYDETGHGHLVGTRSNAVLTGIIWTNLRSNGAQISTVSQDGAIGLWDLDGRPVHPLVKTGETWEDVKFSADGTKILTFGANNSLGTWDLEGRRLGGPVTVERVSQSDTDFTRDSKRLLIVKMGPSTGDGACQIWDTNLKPLSSKLLRRWDAEHHDYLDRIKWSSDGTSITLTDGTALLRDTTGSEIAQLVVGDEKWKFAEFSPDGKYLLTSSDKVHCLWDDNGRLIGKPLRSFRHIRFSPDSRRIAARGSQGIVIWDLQWRPSGEAIDAGEGNFQFSDDSQRIITFDYDWARVWDVSGHPLGERIPSNWYASLSPKDSRIVLDLEGDSIDLDGRVQRMWLFDISGRRLGCWDDGRIFNDAQFAPDGKHIIVTRDGSQSLIVSVEDFATPVKRLYQESEKTKYLIEFARSDTVGPDDSSAAARRKLDVRIQNDGSVEVLGASSSIKVHEFDGRPLHIVSAATDHNGKRVVTGGDDQDPSLRFWDANSWRNVSTFHLSHGVWNIEFTPDDTRLILMLSDGTVEIWDIRDPADRQKDHDLQFAERIPARKYLEQLLAGDTPIEKLNAVIEQDKTLSILRKLAAVEELNYSREVLQNYWDRVWTQIIDPGQSRNTYTEIGKKLKRAIRIEVKHNINALGYLQYRRGDFADAILTLNRAEAFDPDDENLKPGERRHMADWAFLAMAHFRLGNTSEAQECFKAFQAKYKAGDDAHKKRYQALAKEAEALIGSAGAKPMTDTKKK